MGDSISSSERRSTMTAERRNTTVYLKTGARPERWKRRRHGPLREVRAIGLTLGRRRREGRERLRGSRRFDELAAADSQQRAFSGGERRARAGQDAERSERSGCGGQGRTRYCHLRG
ncbi:hypothetical protein ACOSP7_024053 [Xanthoceras sorbifolium]